MMRSYLLFDFGESFFRDKGVMDLILEKMPVSISLGLWTTLLVYLISIPLGIAKAVRDGSRFDVWTSGVVIVGNAIPASCSPSCWSCCSPAAATSTGSRCAAWSRELRELSLVLAARSSTISGTWPCRSRRW
jgi:hypothetical protein